MEMQGRISGRIALQRHDDPKNQPAKQRGKDDDAREKRDGICKKAAGDQGGADRRKHRRDRPRGAGLRAEDVFARTGDKTEQGCASKLRSYGKPNDEHENDAELRVAQRHRA